MSNNLLPLLFYCCYLHCSFGILIKKDLQHFFYLNSIVQSMNPCSFNKGRTSLAIITASIPREAVVPYPGRVDAIPDSTSIPAPE